MEEVGMSSNPLSRNLISRRSVGYHGYSYIPQRESFTARCAWIRVGPRGFEPRRRRPWTLSHATHNHASMVYRLDSPDSD